MFYACLDECGMHFFLPHIYLLSLSLKYGTWNMESISTKERPTMAVALIPVGLSLWLSRPLCLCPLSLINAVNRGVADFL